MERLQTFQLIGDKEMGKERKGKKGKERKEGRERRDKKFNS